MPTQEGEASGSRAPTLRRGRSSTAPTTTNRSMALVRRRRQSSASQSAHKKKMRAREEVSSAGSSPLREIDVPDEIYALNDPGIREAVGKAEADYDAKLARHTAWATLNTRMINGTMCVLDDPKLVPDRESARKTVLYAAQSFLGLTSSVDGKPLAQCCGFWVHWDEENKIGTALTTARLICTKSPSMSAWLGHEEYAIDAEPNTKEKLAGQGRVIIFRETATKVAVHCIEKVLVHLRGNTTEKAQLQYLQKHYDLALFSVKLDRPVHILPFRNDVKHGDQILELGRDESSFLRISHGVVRYSREILLERYHYMHVDGADLNAKYGKGGPLIDFDGKIVGMMNGNTRGSFIPSSILVKCLRLWSKFQCIPRPHLGMKFWSIKFVDIALAENILYMCNIDDGLIVKEVSEGSLAEKLGIRDGDVIRCVDGEHVSTTVELENMLLGKCEDESGSLNSKVDVELRIFHIRKSLWRNKTLNVNVSDDGEVVDRGVRYPFGKGTSVSLVSPSEPSEIPGSVPSHLAEVDTMVNTESLWSHG